MNSLDGLMGWGTSVHQEKSLCRNSLVGGHSLPHIGHDMVSSLKINGFVFWGFPPTSKAELFLTIFSSKVSSSLRVTVLVTFEDPFLSLPEF